MWGEWKAQNMYKHWCSTSAFPVTHRSCPAVVAVFSALNADFGVAVGRVEPARLLPLLPLLQELQGQPRGSALHVLGEHERRDGGGDFHIALVSWLFSHNGLPVGVTRPVTLQQGILRCVGFFLCLSDQWCVCGLTRLSSILISDSNSSSPGFHLYWVHMAKLLSMATSYTSDLYFSGSNITRLSTLPAQEIAFT